MTSDGERITIRKGPTVRYGGAQATHLIPSITPVD